jgi:4-amino-4-deoxy-L-arabinose transferase-like glycosyltransferase
VTTGHEGPFAYYAWTLPVAIAPWLVPFVALFRWNGPLWKIDRADAALLRFAAAMTIAPLAVLSLASSKREVYLLPLLPALALLMATSVTDRIEAERKTPRPGLATRVGDWAQAAILGLIGLAPAAAYIASSHTVTPASAVFALAGLASAAALGASVARRNPARAFWIGSACMGLGLAGAVALVVPKVDAVKNLQPFIASIDTLVPAGAPLPAIGSDETLLGIVPFVTGRRVLPIEAKDAGGAPFVLVQWSEKDQNADGLSPAYERIASGAFGPSRRMALWRRR